jgi:nucleotide-binding universal stress UspA family protein
MYQHILVPVDGSATSNAGLQEAARLAKLTRAKLRLVHVIDDISLAFAVNAYETCAGDWFGELRRTGARLLETAATVAKRQGIDVDTVLCDNFSGSVCDAVIAESKSWKADLIVLGTHGRRGIKRAVLGSSAENILRHAPVPVLLVRGQQDDPPRKEPTASNKASAQDSEISTANAA